MYLQFEGPNSLKCFLPGHQTAKNKDFLKESSIELERNNFFTSLTIDLVKESSKCTYSVMVSESARNPWLYFL